MGQDVFLKETVPEFSSERVQTGSRGKAIHISCMYGEKNAVGESSQRAGWHEYGIENADVTYVGTQ